MEPMQQMEVALDLVRQVAPTGDDQRLRAEMERLRQAIIALGATLQPGEPAPTALRTLFATEVYPRLWAAYGAVGQPSGPDTDGLLRWLSQQAAIAAEIERRQQERRWQRGLKTLRQLILTERTISAS
jgi:hypothetical protein